MTRLLPAALAAAALAGSGCLHVQPIGPLAGPPGASGDAKVKVSAAKDVAAAPVIQPAPPPPPPTVYVSPGEVTDANCPDKARRLAEELDADEAAARAMKQPSDVSVIKK